MPAQRRLLCGPLHAVHRRPPSKVLTVLATAAQVLWDLVRRQYRRSPEGSRMARRRPTALPTTIYIPTTSPLWRRRRAELRAALPSPVRVRTCGRTLQRRLRCEHKHTHRRPSVGRLTPVPLGGNKGRPRTHHSRGAQRVLEDLRRLRQPQGWVPSGPLPHRQIYIRLPVET